MVFNSPGEDREAVEEVFVHITDVHHRYVVAQSLDALEIVAEVLRESSEVGRVGVAREEVLVRLERLNSVSSARQTMEAIIF